MALTNQTIGGSGIAGGTWTIQSTNTAIVGRFHDLAFLQEGSAGSPMQSARTGCLPGPSLSTVALPGCFGVTAAGGLSCSLGRGSAFVERNTQVGPYNVHTEAVGTVTFGTANATNPRIDRVDLQVFDGVLGDNGGVSLTQFVVTQGTAAGVPTLPAAPTNSTPMFKLTLPANTVTITSGMLTDIRRSAGLRGAKRMMLSGDLLTDVGIEAGELRDTSAIRTVGTIDRWDPVSATWVMTADLSAAQTVFYNPAVSVNSITDNTTFTGYRDTSSNLLGTAFVAPASGKVDLSFGASLTISHITTEVQLSINVNTGSTIGGGSSFLAASAGISAVGKNTDETMVSRHVLVTGLTPGSTYNASFTWKMTLSGSTATSQIPWMLAKPIFV
jgi:hypothetical protein